MGQRTDGDEVGAGLGVGAHVLEGDAAGGLDFDGGPEGAGAARPAGEGGGMPPFEPTAWIAAWLATAGMRLRR